MFSSAFCRLRLKLSRPANDYSRVRNCTNSLQRARSRLLSDLLADFVEILRVFIANLSRMALRTRTVLLVAACVLCTFDVVCYKLLETVLRLLC